MLLHWFLHLVCEKRVSGFLILGLGFGFEFLRLVIFEFGGFES
jgi:hypothetical protein